MNNLTQTGEESYNTSPKIEKLYYGLTREEYINGLNYGTNSKIHIAIIHGIRELLDILGIRDKYAHIGEEEKLEDIYPHYMLYPKD